jgi:hypothetical protein
MIVAAIAVGVMYSTPALGPQFYVVGKELNLTSDSGGYMTEWNFTFTYLGDKNITDVDIFVNNDLKPFQIVPQITSGWSNFYLWDPHGLNSTITITVSWANGEERFRFEPQT